MNIQENYSNGVASDRRSMYDERRWRRSPATVAVDRRRAPLLAIVAQ